MALLDFDTFVLAVETIADFLSAIQVAFREGRWALFVPRKQAHFVKTQIHRESPYSKRGNQRLRRSLRFVIVVVVVVVLHVVRPLGGFLTVHLIEFNVFFASTGGVICETEFDDLILRLVHVHGYRVEVQMHILSCLP